MEKQKKDNNVDIKSLDEFSAFCELKRLDGFDVAIENKFEYYEAFYNGCYNHIKKIFDLIGTGDSIYEVGCGAGANLYIAHKYIKGLRVGGCDISQNLLDVACEMLAGEFRCIEGTQLDTEQKYDIVMADSVFQYFPSKDYAMVVLDKMLEKANKLVFLGELHDSEHAKEWLQNRRNTIKDYDIKYEGLGRIFFEKKTLEEYAKSKELSIVFEDVKNDLYWSSKYIYNVYIYK